MEHDFLFSWHAFCIASCLSWCLHCQDFEHFLRGSFALALYISFAFCLCFGGEKAHFQGEFANSGGVCFTCVFLPQRGISARGSLFSGCFELSALISAFKGEFFASGGVSAFSAVLWALRSFYLQSWALRLLHALSALASRLCRAVASILRGRDVFILVPWMKSFLWGMVLNFACSPLILHLVLRLVFFNWYQVLSLFLAFRLLLSLNWC